LVLIEIGSRGYLTGCCCSFYDAPTKPVAPTQLVPTQLKGPDMATNSMPVTIRGRFITTATRKWDSFKDSDGKDVAAGSTVTVFVLDTADNVREIKANGIPGLDRLTFGVEVVCECEARPYRGELKFTAVSIAPAAGVKVA